MVAPQPPFGQPNMQVPGQPMQSGTPNDIRTVGILQLIAGILYLITFCTYVLFSCGFALLAITPIYGAVIAGLEIYNGARALGQNPDPGAFWWKTLPILSIVSVISGDIFSVITGIVALAILNKPEVRNWIR